MSGWHENLVAFGKGHGVTAGRLLGRIEAKVDINLAKQEEALALLRELQNSKPAPSNLGVVKEFGRMAGKAIIPQLAPLMWTWVLALFSAAGAVGWAAWKILRGSMGF